MKTSEITIIQNQCGVCGRFHSSFERAKMCCQDAREKLASDEYRSRFRSMIWVDGCLLKDAYCVIEHIEYRE